MTSRGAFRAQNCSSCGAALGTTGTPTSVGEVRDAIAALPPGERAMLRPWILAAYDVQGKRVHGYVGDTPARREP